MNKKRKILWLAILGGLIVKLAYFIYGRKRKQKLTGVIKANFKKFVREEEKEIMKYEKGKEPFKKYCRDSVNIFKDYFIPSECNDHKPKILRTKSLVVIIIILMSLKIGLTSYLFLSFPDQAKMENQIAAEILNLINDERAKNNLKPLALNSVLSASALAKAENMFILGYFSHYGPDGKKPWDWINREEYPYLFVGENLAMNFYTAAAAHKALLASPTHRDNILSEKYEEIGLAVASGELNGEKTNILVQLFASRQKPSLIIAAAGDKTTAGTTKVQETVKPAEAALPAGGREKISSSEKTAASQAPKAEQKAPAIAGFSTSSAAINSGVNSELSDKPADQADITKNKEAVDKEITAPLSAVSDLSVEPMANEEKLALEKQQAFLAELVARDSQFISPNRDLEAGFLNQIKYVTPAPEDKGLIFKIVQWSKYIYISFLILIIFALLINIFVRITIQHKSVIIEAIIVIIFISGLLAIRLHFFEYFTNKIAII